MYTFLGFTLGYITGRKVSESETLIEMEQKALNLVKTGTKTVFLLSLSLIKR